MPEGSVKGGSKRGTSVASKGTTAKTMKMDLPGMGEPDDVGHVTNEMRALKIREAVLSTFEEMLQARSISASLFYILHIIGFLQLILLPLSPSPSMPWRSVAVPQNQRVGGGVDIIILFHSFLLNVTIVPWIDGFGKLSEFPEFTMWVICLFVASACLFLFSWGFVRALNGAEKNRNSWRVSALSGLTSIVTIALPVPIFANLLGPIACVPSSAKGTASNQTWATYKCWTPGHLGIFSVSLILLVSITIFMILASLLFQSRSPDAKNHATAVAHGRADCIALLTKIILAAVYMGGYNLNPWVHGAVNLVGGVVLVGIYIRLLPHFNPKLNQFLVALYAGFLASSISSFLAIAVSSGSGTAFASAAGGLLWVFLLPLCSFLGWTLTASRWRSIGKSTELTDIYIAELRMRWLLAEGLRLQASAAASSRSSSAGASQQEDNFVAVPMAPPTTGRVCPVAPGADEDGDEKQLPEGHPPTNNTNRVGGRPSTSARIVAATKAPPYGIFGQGLAVTSEAMSNNLRAIKKLLEDSLLAFPNSALLRVFAAHVIRASQGNLYLEASHLRQADEMGDAGEIDVHHFTASRISDLNEEKHRVMTGKMTVEMRIYFEQQMQVATQKVSQCRTAILSFWNTLCEPSPDLVALQTKGVAIYAATKESEMVFRELLTLVPTSVPVLRKYSEFLLEVTNNPGLAEELMNDADQIEDEQSKLQSTLKDVSDFEFGNVASFDMTADGVALMSVSARLEADSFGGVPSIGVVTFGNPACLRILGYAGAKRELLGKEMSLVIANPIAAIHPKYLSGFVQTGITRISGSSRNLFVLHRSGHIVPIMGIVQAVGDQWLVAFEEVSAPHIAFVWVLDGTSNWRISAACRRSMSLFGISPTSLRSGGVSMTNYCENMQSLIARVVEYPGSVVQLHDLPKRRGAAERHESSAMSVHSARSSRVSTGAVGYYKAFVQELAVPLVASTIYIFKFLTASPAEIKAAELSGFITVPDEDDEDDDDDDDNDFDSGPDDGSVFSDLDLVGKDSDSNVSENDLDSVDVQSDGSEEEIKKTRSPKKGELQAAKKKPVKEAKSAPPENKRLGFKQEQSEAAALKKKAADTREKEKEKVPTIMKTDKTPATGERPKFHVGFSEPDAAPVSFEEIPEAKFTSDSGRFLNEKAPPRFEDSQAEVAFSSRFQNQTKTPQDGKMKGRSEFEAPPDKPAESAQKETPKPKKGLFKLAGVINDITKDKEKTPSKRNIAASVASGDSQNSRTMSVTEQIRAGVSVRSRRMESSLLRLRSSILIVFVIICITNIASYVVTRILTQTALTNILEMRELAKVGTYVRRSAKLIQVTTLTQEGKFVNPDSLAWTRERIRTSVNEAERIHRALYLRAVSKDVVPGEASELDTYVIPNLDSVSLVPGSYVDHDNYNFTTEKMSLNNMMISYASRLRSIWFYDFPQHHVSDPDIFWVLETGGVHLVSALNASIFAKAASKSATNSVRLGNSIVLGVALFVFVMVASIVIIPATLAVLAEQREVFEVFAAVPIKVIRHIRDRLTERISYLAREAAGVEGGEDIEAAGFIPKFDDDNDNDDAGGGDGDKGLRMRPGTSLALVVAQGVAKDQNKNDDEEDDPKRAAAERRRQELMSLFCCSSKKGHKRNHKRSFSRNNSGFFGLLVKMLWPILCFVAYYTGMYFQRASVADLEETSQVLVHWIVELEVLVPAVGFAFRNAALFAEPNYTDHWMKVFEERLGFLDLVAESVTFGNKHYHLPSIISKSPGAFALLMENGCVDNTITDEECAMAGAAPGCTYFYDVAMCKKPYDSIDATRPVFANGVVGTGLLPGIQYLSRLLHEVLVERKKQRENGGYIPDDILLVHNDEAAHIHLLAGSYLPAGLASLTDVVVSESIELINAGMNVDIIAVIISIGALFGFYFLLYAPLVIHLDNEIKRTRFLLLLFPEEVAKGVPAVVKAGRKLVSGVEH
jgi:hypothetical protein